MAGGHYNEQGRYHEVLFKAECLKRRLVVLQPECTHLAFDVAIFSRGKFITVQVKGTSVIRPHHSGGKRALFQCRGNGAGVRSKTYHERGVDFVAAYAQPIETWYIVPSIFVTGATIEIWLGPNSKSSEWKERWELLGAPLEVD